MVQYLRVVLNYRNLELPDLSLFHLYLIVEVFEFENVNLQGNHVQLALLVGLSWVVKLCR